MFILFIIQLFLNATYSQDAFFNLAFGPDIGVIDKENSKLTDTRFRINMEIGTRNIGFVFQPSFGSGYTSIFLGPRFMIPFQVGSKALFIVPDSAVGVDFSFDDKVLGTALDIKFGFRVFYEIQNSMAISFRPFGLNIRPFNVWYGSTPNQFGLVLRYELMLGFTYFF